MADIKELLGRRVQAVTERGLNDLLRDYLMTEAIPLCKTIGCTLSTSSVALHESRGIPLRVVSPLPIPIRRARFCAVLSPISVVTRNRSSKQRLGTLWATQRVVQAAATDP